jgi:ubiquinone/menaquinone biosynthesis C-methylase UbiE
MSNQPQVPDANALKERQVKIWTAGEYARIGNPIAIMGELLCEAVDLHSGDDVLDVATGSGNTAISAARRFCNVTGMDLAPESIEHARGRAEAEAMDITFEVGDAEDLPYEDASFDVVVSTIGVMFCPDQEAAAGELLRVCKPGGRSGSPAGRPIALPGRCSRPWASTSHRPPA